MDVVICLRHRGDTDFCFSSLFSYVLVNVNVFWFPYHSVTVNNKCFGCGQNRKFEDVILFFFFFFYILETKQPINFIEFDEFCNQKIN